MHLWTMRTLPSRDISTAIAIAATDWWMQMDRFYVIVVNLLVLFAFHFVGRQTSERKQMEDEKRTNK